MIEKERQDIKKNILNKIKSGNVTMKSRAHFMLKTVAYVSTLVLAFGFVIYFTSFIVFLFRSNGILLLPSFGSLGILPLIFGLPWLLIILVGILILVLEMLAKHFAFVYRKPLIYSVLAVVVLVVGLSGVVASTTIHDRALEFARDGRLPLGGSLYRHYDSMFLSGEGPTIGTIIEIGENYFTITNREGKNTIISTSTTTRFPRNADLEVGDKIIVIIASPIEGETLQALGVRKFKNERIYKKFRAERGERVHF